jgi:hypothetical protein
MPAFVLAVVRRSKSLCRSERLGVARHVCTNVSGLILIEHPSLVLRVLRILLAQAVPDDFAGPILIEVAEFAGQFSGFVCGHAVSVRLPIRY